MCFYCRKTEVAICHCFLIRGWLYSVKILFHSQNLSVCTESYYFRWQRKVISLCHPFPNMPYFFILFSSPLYYILFCAQLIVLISFSPHPPLFLSSPLSSLPRPSRSTASPLPALIPTLLSIPTLAFKSQTPEPKAYFTGSDFPLLTQCLVLVGGWLTQAIQIFN